MAALEVPLLVELMYALTPLYLVLELQVTEFDSTDTLTTVVHFESEYLVIVTVVEVAVIDSYVVELVG